LGKRASKKKNPVSIFSILFLDQIKKGLFKELFNDFFHMLMVVKTGTTGRISNHPCLLLVSKGFSIVYSEKKFGSIKRHYRITVLAMPCSCSPTVNKPLIDGSPAGPIRQGNLTIALLGLTSTQIFT